MTLKPWREIARPHRDVLEGTFQQSEFAADISQVANGKASLEYQDAKQFFARTFITEGMKLLLMSVARRLAGLGGDPVIQLQTAFGGGKTHTMLAVYHLATREVSTSELEGIPPILDEVGVTDLPRAKVAVLDGISLSPSQELVKQSGQKVTTLWGELAFQLLGQEGLEMIQSAHEEGTSPGKELMIQLLERAAPCVILMDELVAYLRQFEPSRVYRAGTFDSNLTFIQALTEAMKAVPNALLLASLPESELEVGGTMGKRALESLEKYFARVESVWKPVATEEAFEIVRRRLFETAGDRDRIEETCREFVELYKSHSSKFPHETQNHHYFERLCNSYPIHPEVFDRLYEDWSTLDKFQRTRGVLQYMAIVINKLWNNSNADAMIMPGSIAMDDSTVRTKSIHYLPQGWEPVIESEVDGPRSEAHDIDSRDTRFGSVHAAKRAMRTIFLGSAPAASHQNIRGIQSERILLGAAQPQQTLAVFEDVLKRLRDKLQYLYADQDRYWLDTKPNLRREMESRKRGVSDADELIPLLRKELSKLISTSQVIRYTHVFVSSNDVPDEIGQGLRLVVLPLDAKYSRAADSKAQDIALNILENRGDQGRQRRNRLLFLAPDSDSVMRLKDAARTYLAWKSIVSDIQGERINLDAFQTRQARAEETKFGGILRQSIKDTYKWLMSPYERQTGDRFELEWDCEQISTSGSNIAQSIEAKIIESEWVITSWSPQVLKMHLDRWYFKNEVVQKNAQTIFQDTTQYLYMPRVLNEGVFTQTLAAGLSSQDYFAYASGQDGDRYQGFIFGGSAFLTMDTQSLIIERSHAQQYLSKIESEEEGREIDSQSTNEDIGQEIYDTGSSTPSLPPSSRPISNNRYKHYTGIVELNANSSKVDFMEIYEEIIEKLTADPNIRVSVSVEIRAESSEGFTEKTIRSIRENSRTLSFRIADFEED